MIGAIVGDIIGSQYEARNVKYKDFELFPLGCGFTDDTIMTCAVADGFDKWIKSGLVCASGPTCSEVNGESSISRSMTDLGDCLVSSMLRVGSLYPDIGYGPSFRKWILGEIPPLPYNSFGNGSAMRVSSAAWFASSLDETLEFARISAAVSHNHPDGIAGAQALAGCVFLARQHKPNEVIADFVKNRFYDLDFTIESIRSTYKFDVSCKGSVPQAIVAFLEGTDFEDCIRNAVSIGGDSDTIAAMTGAIAEARYGVPQELVRRSFFLLTPPLREIVKTFYARFDSNHHVMEIASEIQALPKVKKFYFFNQLQSDVKGYGLDVEAMACRILHNEESVSAIGAIDNINFCANIIPRNYQGQIELLIAQCQFGKWHKNSYDGSCGCIGNKWSADIVYCDDRRVHIEGNVPCEDMKLWDALQLLVGFIGHMGHAQMHTENNSLRMNSPFSDIS